MTLIKTTFWTGLSTLIKLAASFFIAKILAVYLGPIGFGIFGQFQNFVSIILVFSGNIIRVGVVKYVAEFKNNRPEKGKVLSTAFFIALFSSILIGAGLFASSDFFSIFLFKQINFSWLIDIFALSLSLYIFNSFMISILNGEGEIKLMTFINMSTSIGSFIFTYFLARYFGISGALLAQVLGQSIFFGLTIFLVKHQAWFCWDYFNKGPYSEYAIKLLKFASMSFVSAFMLLAAQMIIRTYIARVLSWQDAGYWQAVTRISDNYLALITSTLSVYYLPKLSSLSTTPEIKAELKKAYLTVFPVVTLMSFLVYLFRKKIIFILLSPSFMPMEPLFLFQLLGDVFKIGAWLLVYNLLSKAMTKVFIFSEIAFGIVYCGLSILFLKSYGLEGVTMAFCLSYLLYFFFMGFICCRKFQLCRR